MAPLPTFFDRRKELEELVASCLSTYEDGRIAPPEGSETQSLDFKEEAGRRTKDGEIQPGSPTNPEAATKLADEVACMANSPGGGALVVGIADKDGRVIGTELNLDWLRHRIDQAVSVAPDIVETHVGGQRVLVIYVAESREPVFNTGNALRWRVGDHCEAIDRAQWWEHRERMSHADDMAQATQRTLSDVRPGAIQLVRDWVSADPTEPDLSLLRKLGAVHSDGHLTHAAALCLCPVGRVGIDFTIFDVPGGNITGKVTPNREHSLFEQLNQVETALSQAIPLLTVRTGLVHEQVSAVPSSVVREALLNGVIHRDWNRHEPTEVRWTQLDYELTVRSPGGFPGSITATTILSNREARYPALADLFRAVGLVEKQGVGVDRMYRDMIIIGHRPPDIREVGQSVECTVRGGEPVFPVLNCVRAIVPRERQNDFRLALILHHLLHHPFVTVTGVAQLLQDSEIAAQAALETARQTMVKGQPLIRGYKDVWILSGPTRKILEDAFDEASPTPLMPYTSTDPAHQGDAAREWIDAFGKVTTGDLAELTGTSRGTAKRSLDTLAEEGLVTAVGAGRSSGYVAS